MKSLAKYLLDIKSYLLFHSKGMNAAIEEVVVGVTTIEDEEELVLEVIYNIQGTCVLAQTSVSLEMLEQLDDTEGFGLVIQGIMNDLSEKLVEQELVTIH